MTPVGSERRGAVLVVVVLMAVAVFAMAHGLLLSARHALAAARTGATLVEVRAAAEGALEAARAESAGPWMDSVPIGAARMVEDTLPEGDSVRTGWRRLGEEAWLVGVSVRRERFPPVGAERLFWVYDPLERVRAVPSGLTVGEGATVGGAGTLRAPDPTVERADASADLQAACAPWWDAWIASPPAGPPAAVGFVDAPALGLLDLETLLARAPELPDPLGTPAPTEIAGRCDEADPWSWGDPDEPTRPCGAYHALRARTGATTIAGGVGQGVLVVDGDLELSAGARLYGVVLVTGRLRLTGGARLEGLALAQGGAEMDGGTELVGSVCRAARALQGVRDRLGTALPLHAAARFGPRGDGG